MTAPAWSFVVDWNGDGDFSDTGEAITRVLAEAGITVTYGRDSARSTAPVDPGQATVTLNNTSGDYSPDKSTGPLYGNLGPGRAVRLQANHNAVTYDVFRGVIDAYELTVEPPEQTVQLGLVDAIAQLSAVQVSTGLYPGLRTDQAIAIVLDEAGWGTARDLDPGATMVHWWWADGVSAWEAIQQLVDSEGPGALATVDATGNFVFRSRHHRLLRSASTTSQATFRSSGAEPRISALQYDAGWRDVVNVVEFSVDIRQPTTSGVSVWSSEDVLPIEDGDTVTVVAQPSDPVYGAVVPVDGTDFTTVSGAVDVSINRTSGQSITISLMAVGGPAVVRGMQLRAIPVPVVRTMQVTAYDSASITKYGRRSWTGSAPWAGFWDAKAIASLILAYRAERLPTVAITLRAGDDSRLVQQLSRDLSDRVTIVNADTGVNGDFWISRIEHTANPRWLETTFHCEQAPVDASNPFRFDLSGSGFNDGQFGNGFDDPDTIFVFDGGSGHRFDEGKFSV